MTESIPQSDSFAEVEWGAAEAVTRQVALRVLSEGLPKEATLLNINVPARPSIPLRWRITRQSAKRYYSAVSPGARDWSQSHELDWRALDGMDEVERDSDIWAVMHDGVVSITPMSWDQTARCEWEFEQHVGGG
jgi:5'-nucleotidase